LDVNRSKCVVLVPQRDQHRPNAMPRELLDWSDANSIPIATDLFVPTLGSVIGHDDDGMAAWAVDRARKHESVLSMIPKLKTQMAVQVLRLAGVPRFNNVMRTLPPRISLPAARLFDRMVSTCFKRISGISDTEYSDHIQRQSALPLRLGGIGLSSYEQAAPAAYIGACAEAAKELNMELVHDRLSQRQVSVPAAAVAAAAAAVAAAAAEAADAAASVGMEGPKYPPLPRDHHHMDEKHSTAAVSDAAVSASSSVAAGNRKHHLSEPPPDDARPLKRRRTSSLARLPPPRVSASARAPARALPSVNARGSVRSSVRFTAVENVEECIAMLNADFKTDSSAVEALAKVTTKDASAFWCKYGEVMSDEAWARSGLASSALAAATAADRSAINSGVSVRSPQIGCGNGLSKEENSGDGKGNELDLQKRIVTIAHSVECKRLAKEVSNKAAARLAACRAKGAWCWLLVSPIEDALVLTDGEMRSALRHQFGLSPLADSWYCKCGEPATAGHFHVCNRVSGPSTYARHESVVSELCAIGTTHLDMSVSRAPSIALTDGSLAATEDGKRNVVPDLCLDGAAISLAIDVSVCYAEADSYLRMGGHEEKKVLHVLAKRALVKSNKYTVSCAEQGIEFKPFVMESHGSLHSSAEDVLDRLAQYGSDASGCAKAELLGYLHRRVAIALQRGNARLDRMAVAKSRNSYGAAVARGIVVPRRADSGASR
jgi:hypothetical protein